jgi:hypothetical protein
LSCQSCFENSRSRDPADRRDAVVALLAVNDAMRVAERLERRVRELLLAALDFLQAQHIRPLLLEQAGDLVDPQADRVDVPSGDRNHGASDRDGERSRQGSALRALEPVGQRKPPSRGQWDGGSF